MLRRNLILRCSAWLQTPRPAGRLAELGPSGPLYIMRSKTKTALLVSAILWVVAMMVWPGCAWPPIPATRKPILSRKKEDFAFPKPPPPSRSEIVGKLGEPDAYFPDLRVACYRVNEVTKRNLWLLLFIIPVDVEKNPGYVDVAFIEFDESDHVRRSRMSTVDHFDALHLDALAKKWLASQEAKKRKD